MATKKEIKVRDTGRNIGEELLQAVRDVKAGNYGAKYQVDAVRRCGIIIENCCAPS